MVKVMRNQTTTGDFAAKIMTKSNYRKYFGIVFCLIAVGIVAGCANTFHGMGQDIERAGEKIQGATR